MDLSQIQINQAHLQGQNNSMEFQNFLDFQNENLNSSMVSQGNQNNGNKSNEQINQEKAKNNDFDDFNDCKSQKLNDSVLSQKYIPEAPIQENKLDQ